MTYAKSELNNLVSVSLYGDREKTWEITQLLLQARQREIFWAAEASHGAELQQQKWCVYIAT
jgi:hypothetical protein